MANSFLHTTRPKPNPNLTKIPLEPNLNPTRTSSTQTQTLCEPYLNLAQTQTGNGFN